MDEKNVDYLKQTGLDNLEGTNDFEVKNEAEFVTDSVAESAVESAVEPEAAAEIKIEPEVEDNSEKKSKKTYKNKDGKKSKKGLIIVLLILILLASAAIAVWQVYEHYVLVGDIFGSYKVYARNVSEVDLSGSDIQDFSGLERLDEIKKIDLTNASVQDLSVIYNCKSLETVILSGSDIPADKCIEFYDALPNAKLKCNVIIGNDTYDSQISELKLDGLIDDELSSVAALRYLKTLDLTGSDVSNAKYDYLHEKLPDCLIKRNVKILDVTAESTVTLIDLRGYKYSFDEFKAAFDENLKYFPDLEKVDMCYCGLSDEQMAELNNTYSGIKFVWIVSVGGGRWKVRSDATVFSTLNGKADLDTQWTEEDFAPLYKYCTDLVALDVGHNYNRDISEMANLTKLRAIILTDNQVTDISCFAEMKDLEFIEANASNRIKSVEPLKDLKNLKYINLYSNKPATDLSPLYNHDNLELCIFHASVAGDERKRFRESNPNCETYFTVDIGPDPEHPITTNKAWRNNPYRDKIKEAFANWKYVVGFDEETGEYIFDWNTDQYKVISR